MIIKRFLLLLALVGSLSCFAQDDCETTLSRAEDEFASGHFYIIPGMLGNCLTQFTKEQRQRAYVLLSQTYLLLDDPIGARQSYLSLLKANPEFLPDTALHPIDLIYLSKKFTSTAVLSWFARAGANVSPVRVIYDNTTSGQPGARDEYSFKTGYQAGVGGDLYITERIGLRAELNFLMTSYQLKSSDNFFSPASGASDSRIVVDRQSWITLPVMVTYSDDLGKYRPFGYAGYGFHYLLSDRASIVYDDIRPGTSDISENSTITQESPTLNFIDKRNRFNQSIVVGGGLKVKIGLDFIFVDARYNIGLKNVVKPDGAYGNYNKYSTNQELISNGMVDSLEPLIGYGHIDDYFRLDNMSISFGFIRPLYKPRELKKARTKSVMRRM